MRGGHSSSGLLHHLEEDFQSRTGLVMHQDCRPIGNLPPEPKTLCCVLGFCICKGRGLQASTFHKNLVSFLRNQFTPKRKRKDAAPLDAAAEARQKTLKENRDLLNNGRIVAQLHAHVKPVEGLQGHEIREEVSQVGLTGGWGSFLEENMRDSNQQVFWFHLGYVNYTSWHCSLMQLQEDDEYAHSDLGFRKLVFRREQSIQSAIRVSPAHFKELVDFEPAWFCTVHCIVENDDILGDELRLTSCCRADVFVFVA